MITCTGLNINNLAREASGMSRGNSSFSFPHQHPENSDQRLSETPAFVGNTSVILPSSGRFLSPLHSLLEGKQHFNFDCEPTPTSLLPASSQPLVNFIDLSEETSSSNLQEAIPEEKEEDDPLLSQDITEKIIAYYRAKTGETELRIIGTTRANFRAVLDARKIVDKRNVPVLERLVDFYQEKKENEGLVGPRHKQFATVLRYIEKGVYCLQQWFSNDQIRVLMAKISYYTFVQIKDMPHLVSPDSMQRAVKIYLRDGNENELCQRLESLKANFVRQSPNASLNSSNESTPRSETKSPSPLYSPSHNSHPNFFSLSGMSHSLQASGGSLVNWQHMNQLWNQLVSEKKEFLRLTPASTFCSRVCELIDVSGWTWEDIGTLLAQVCNPEQAPRDLAAFLTQIKTDVIHLQNTGNFTQAQIRELFMNYPKARTKLSEYIDEYSSANTVFPHFRDVHQVMELMKEWASASSYFPQLFSDHTYTTRWSQPYVESFLEIHNSTLKIHLNQLIQPLQPYTNGSQPKRKHHTYAPGAN
ncbi:hypothetical protein [Coxiella burnetii]|uniref:Uncharacterized protein n=1 Tax=Coxiella burnetii (strain RSA 493 / Nine Mile phase I) TaxID=227377 RepID=Q83AU8_COXBU|nr:hypothetical protein [Coxiella burnetii]NP_820760.2 hypothetical protein CBU_1780 [Coxiella burnetii RSA 493]AAO91274.2 hypothetical protein CBU_1780 [Coxiella burnetii RSA 493]ARI66535.1 hypothetical protein B7L74_09155 [Coxiella burnetii]MCF2094457.1 hypothetical protein [Coxiella burnetii]MCF2096386.1 hypothetical protein [Coxiella burnetii]MCF2098524.1 hypothetical protein [Coxiella burnetii]